MEGSGRNEPEGVEGVMTEEEKVFQCRGERRCRGEGGTSGAGFGLLESRCGRGVCLGRSGNKSAHECGCRTQTIKGVGQESNA